MTVKVTRTAKVSGGILRLQDIRELVAQTTDFPATAMLSISASRDPRDGNYYSITVTE